MLARLAWDFQDQVALYFKLTAAQPSSMRGSSWVVAMGVTWLMTAGCRDDNAPRVETSWRLVGADGVSKLSCEQAGTKELNVHVHNGESPDRSTHVFTQIEPCSAGQATSGTLEEGLFWVTISLMDSQGHVVATQSSGPYELTDGFVVKIPTMILKPR
jgi:hypothetical protein